MSPFSYTFVDPRRPIPTGLLREPSQAEINRAMERATQIDTFAGIGRDEGRGMGNFGGEQGMWTSHPYLLI